MPFYVIAFRENEYKKRYLNRDCTWSYALNDNIAKFTDANRALYVASLLDASVLEFNGSQLIAY